MCAATTCIICSIIWFFIASLLLFFSWNKVICHISSLKTVKYWQALLFIATIVVLCLPKYAHKMHYSKSGCPVMKTDSPHPKMMHGKKMPRM